MPERIASIDFGTNTARLLIADRFVDGSFSQVALKRKIVRLGGGFSRRKGLSDEAMDRAISCLREFRAEMELQGVADARAAATSAVRDAANGPEFVNRVKAETGITLTVIPGDLEGRFTLKGILAGLDVKPEKMIMFDVGGGSTEYLIARGASPSFVSSLPLGVVRLTEGKDSVNAISEKILRELSALKVMIKEAGETLPASDTMLVGTAGTATTLAAISLKMEQYDYRKVNNCMLSIEEIRRIYSMLLPLSPQERLSVPGLEPGREDLIVAGTLVTLLTMETLGFEHMKVSDYGLLEGLVVASEWTAQP